MPERRLSAEEAEIWGKVAATVRRREEDDRLSHRHAELVSASIKPRVPEQKETWTLNQVQGDDRAKRPSISSDTLDGGWDRRLRRGVVQPDRSIDLHGHTLASAHALLDRALDRAIADELRVLLVITGKPPRDPAPHRRGLIRASIGDWLAGSRHAGRIAAVRNAHPRHGGAGALYVILRRARSE